MSSSELLTQVQQLQQQKLELYVALLDRVDPETFKRLMTSFNEVLRLLNLKESEYAAAKLREEKEAESEAANRRERLQHALDYWDLRRSERLKEKSISRERKQ